MLTTFLIAIFAVALMVIGLSITLIRKGHNIQGDVGDNDEMKARGLRCTVEEMSDHGECPSADGGCCTHCDIDCNIR